MKKILFMFLFLCALFLYKKLDSFDFNDSDYASNYLSPCFKNDYSLNVFNDIFLGDVELYNGDDWFYFYKYPMSFIFVKQILDLKKILPKSNFKILTYDSLLIGLNDTLAETKFEYDKFMNFLSISKKQKNNEKEEIKIFYDKNGTSTGFSKKKKSEEIAIAMEEIELYFIMYDSVYFIRTEIEDKIDVVKSFFLDGKENSFYRIKTHITDDKRMEQIFRTKELELDSKNFFDTIRHNKNYKYDEDSNLIEMVVKNNNGGKIALYQKKFENGLLINEIRESYLKKNEHKILYQDSLIKNEIIYIKNYHEKKDSILISWYYNPIGLLLKKEISSSFEQPLSKVLYEYKEDGYQNEYYFDNKENIIGWFKKRNRIIEEIAQPLIEDSKINGFRVFKFLDHGVI